MRSPCTLSFKRKDQMQACMARLSNQSSVQWPQLPPDFQRDSRTKSLLRKAMNFSNMAGVTRSRHVADMRYHLQAHVWGGLSSHPTVAGIDKGWFICLPNMPSAQGFAQVSCVCEEPITSSLPRMDDDLGFVGLRRHSILKNSHERNPQATLTPASSHSVSASDSLATRAEGWRLFWYRGDGAPPGGWQAVSLPAIVRWA